MKDVLLLTKILFKSSLNRNSSKKESKFGKIILYLFVYAYIGGFVSYMSYIYISSLKLLNQETLFLKMCFSASILLGIIQTLFTSLNLLFFSKDIEYLLPFPVSPLKIIMSKFNCLIIAQYFTSIVFLTPVFLTYGILLKCELLFYIIRIINNFIIANYTSCNICFSYNFSDEIY